MGCDYYTRVFISILKNKICLYTIILGSENSPDYLWEGSSEAFQHKRISQHPSGEGEETLIIVCCTRPWMLCVAAFVVEPPPHLLTLDVRSNLDKCLVGQAPDAVC